jgi:hypothetical protein
MKSDKPDPLAKFRRPAIEPAKPAVEYKEAETYAAFAAKDRVERLQIRRVQDMHRAPRYLHLADIGWDGHYGLTCSLFFDDLIVLIRGKNLQGMVAALLSGTAEFIQEYHPELWDKPPDDAPIIEYMEIHVRGEQSAPESKDGKTH